jgi:hypothetical protein
LVSNEKLKHGHVFAGKADVNTAAFDPAKCTNQVAQAEFVNGLGRLLGLVPGQIKITSTVGWYAFCEGSSRAC